MLAVVWAPRAVHKFVLAATVPALVLKCEKKPTGSMGQICSDSGL